jgi:heme O synthase-like polyprenyltransferase
MKHGNRPILSADDFAMACAAFGFAVGMIGLAAVALACVLLAGLFAPFAIAIAVVAYIVEVIVFWWEHT